MIGSADEIANALLKEVDAVYAFLQDQVGAEADNLIPSVADAIIMGKPLSTPKLTVSIVKGRMDYQVTVAGASELAGYIPSLKSTAWGTSRSARSPSGGWRAIPTTRSPNAWGCASADRRPPARPDPPPLARRAAGAGRRPLNRRAARMAGCNGSGGRWQRAKGRWQNADG